MPQGVFEADLRGRVGSARARRAVGSSALGKATPNLVLQIGRVALGLGLAAALVLGPETLGNMGLRFAIAYAVAISAVTALPRRSILEIAIGLALLFGMRWAFSSMEGGTIEMLLVQFAGIGCALAPVYARNVGRLAGVTEGHISFTERRAMWRRSTAAGAASRPAPPTRRTAPATAMVALPDLRPEPETLR